MGSRADVSTLIEKPLFCLQLAIIEVGRLASHVHCYHSHPFCDPGGTKESSANEPLVKQAAIHGDNLHFINYCLRAWLQFPPKRPQTEIPKPLAVVFAVRIESNRPRSHEL